METFINLSNRAGELFCDFSWPMLIQSTVLIAVLYAVDGLIRKRVRAVVRYGLWMLVLVKLVLPPTLSVPTGVGYWVEMPTVSSMNDWDAFDPVFSLEPHSPAVEAASSQPLPHVVTPSQPVEPIPTEQISFEAAIASEPREVVTPSLTWQAWVLLAWLAGVLVISVLLLKRLNYVRRLVKQSHPVHEPCDAVIESCATLVPLKRPVEVRTTEELYSPAACGLFRPVILVPQSIEKSLSPDKLKAVLLHERLHIKRGDLWINLIQTLLQVVYFFHPLLWLANGTIRRLREKAVDETVLTRQGQDDAGPYSDTLIDIAEIAMARPSFTLGLIGVVESKKALADRIKHMVTRPIPKTTKVGLIGLGAIMVLALALLPMAKGGVFDWWLHRDRLVKFESLGNANGTRTQEGDIEYYVNEYNVAARPNEQLLVFAELYQNGQPMRRLGHKIFTGSTQPRSLSVELERRLLNDERTHFKLSGHVVWGGEDCYFNEVSLEFQTPLIGTDWSFYQDSEIRSTSRDLYWEGDMLMMFSGRGMADAESPSESSIWMPGYHVSQGFCERCTLLIKMIPMSQIGYLKVEAPHLPVMTQLSDGSYLSVDANEVERQAVADEYVLDIKRMLMRDRMPLPKLYVHAYYQQGEPITLYFQSKGYSWGPELRNIYLDDDPIFIMIDGNDYISRRGLGPFGDVGSRLRLPDDLWCDDDFNLSAGRHTVAFGWKNIDVIDPCQPDQSLHFNRLLTDVVEFEVVEAIPENYYRPVYQEGWEDILRKAIETPFTDDWQKGVTGALLGLRVTTDHWPFNTAFQIYVQAEGRDDLQLAGDLTLQSGSQRFSTSCDYRVKGLDWESVGDKRWRIILKPSVEVAKARPPIREYYSREFVTDWLTFERSPQFDMHRKMFEKDPNAPKHYAGTLRADKPIDLERLSTKRLSDRPDWPLPEGYDLGWSTDNGGTLKIDPNSNVRMLWISRAHANRLTPKPDWIDRLPKLGGSQLSEIIPPQDKSILIAVQSSQGKIYWVSVRKVNETWADLRWWEHQDSAP